VDQQDFMAGRCEGLQQKHPEVRHEVAGYTVVGVIEQDSHDGSPPTRESLGGRACITPGPSRANIRIGRVGLCLAERLIGFPSVGRRIPARWWGKLSCFEHLSAVNFQLNPKSSSRGRWRGDPSLGISEGSGSILRESLGG